MAINWKGRYRMLMFLLQKLDLREENISMLEQESSGLYV
jgi:hypothetical protein